jgi:hypothetical protein
MPLPPEYDFELHRKDIERLLIFPMVIYTPQYGKLFRSNGISNLAGLLKLFSGQSCAS